MSYRRDRFELDSQRFVRDMRKACVELGVSLARMAEELSMHRYTISVMESKGRVPAGRSLVAMAAYCGLNLNDYLIDFEDAKFPSHPPKKSWTFTSALERIKQLEEELKKCTTKI